MKTIPSLLVVIFLLEIPAELAAARRPNVLFILADDMRPDAIASLGNSKIKTPALDRLVSRGMVFPHAYCMGSMVGAVCTPSRTMILTGRSLFRIPRQDSRDKYALWPRAMNAGGYETFHLGKRGNSFLPGMRAFDTSLFTGQIGADDHLVSSEKTVDRIIDFLHTRRNDKPFFIYMAPPVPHDPRICPKGFMDLYDPARMPTPVSFLPFHPFDNGEMTVRDELLAPHPRTEAVIRRHLADAYACITCLDHHIGRLLDVLKGMGELENTIVIFAADNGLSLGDHGLMGKQNLYEFGGMHVPLVMSGPGIPQGKSAAFVYLMDLFPTVCELTATPIPPLVEARSLAPILRGQASKIRDTAFTAYKDVQRAIRDERWKLIRYPQINRTQLFDLKADPHELNDLSSDPKHSDMVKEMLALLAKAQKEYGDTCPLSVVSPRDGRWSPDRRQEKPTRLPKTGTY